MASYALTLVFMRTFQFDSLKIDKNLTANLKFENNSQICATTLTTSTTLTTQTANMIKMDLIGWSSRVLRAWMRWVTRVGALRSRSYWIWEHLYNEAFLYKTNLRIFLDACTHKRLVLFYFFIIFQTGLIFLDSFASNAEIELSLILSGWSSRQTHI